MNTSSKLLTLTLATLGFILACSDNQDSASDDDKVDLFDKAEFSAAPALAGQKVVCEFQAKLIDSSCDVDIASMPTIKEQYYLSTTESGNWSISDTTPDGKALNAGPTALFQLPNVIIATGVNEKGQQILRIQSKPKNLDFTPSIDPGMAPTGAPPKFDDLPKSAPTKVCQEKVSFETRLAISSGTFSAPTTKHVSVMELPDPKKGFPATPAAPTNHGKLTGMDLLGDYQVVQGFEGNCPDNVDATACKGSAKIAAKCVDEDATEFDTSMDTDKDGIPNEIDKDIDGDGLDNGLDPDVDGDGKANADDDDVDDDGKENGVDADVDGDQVLNGEDPDIDGDGTPNAMDEDMDGDGLLNVADNDIDSDSLINQDDPDPSASGKKPSAGDGDGNSDGDGDGDGSSGTGTVKAWLTLPNFFLPANSTLVKKFENEKNDEGDSIKLGHGRIYAIISKDEKFKDILKVAEAEIIQLNNLKKEDEIEDEEDGDGDFDFTEKPTLKVQVDGVPYGDNFVTFFVNTKGTAKPKKGCDSLTKCLDQFDLVMSGHKTIPYDFDHMHTVGFNPPRANPKAISLDKDNISDTVGKDEEGKRLVLGHVWDICEDCTSQSEICFINKDTNASNCIGEIVLCKDKNDCDGSPLDDSHACKGMSQIVTEDYDHDGDGTNIDYDQIGLCGK